MTTTDELPVIDDDPAAGSAPAAEGVALTRTGLVRMRMARKTYRLRRPFFGEFKSIRTGMEDLTDAITSLVDETRAVGARLRTEFDTALEAAGDDVAAQSAVRADFRVKDRAGARKLQDDMDAERIVWWSKVFGLVSIDGTPAEDEWPAWLFDDTLPGRVVEHWRSVPLAPG